MTGEQSVVTCWGVFADALAAALAAQRDADQEQADRVTPDAATGEHEALGGRRTPQVLRQASHRAGLNGARPGQVTP